MKVVLEREDKVSDYGEKAKKILKRFIKKANSKSKETTKNDENSRDNTVGGYKQ